MRIAVLSDVHGNLPALEAVLRDIEAREADEVICLGDICFKGPAPEECAEALRERGIPTVQGNTDLRLCQVARGEPGAADQDQMPYLDWHLRRMSAGSVTYLAGLPFSLRRAFGSERLLFVHATPDDIEGAIRPEDPEEAAAAKVERAGADWIFMGHVHRPFARVVAGMHLVNVGAAVGIPLDGDPRAAYAMLDAQAREGRRRAGRVRHRGGGRPRATARILLRAGMVTKRRCAKATGSPSPGHFAGRSTARCRVRVPRHFRRRLPAGRQRFRRSGDRDALRDQRAASRGCRGDLRVAL